MLVHVLGGLVVPASRWLLIVVLSVVTSFLAVAVGATIHYVASRRLRPAVARTWGVRYWMRWIALAVALAAQPFIVWAIYLAASPHAVDPTLAMRRVMNSSGYVLFGLGLVLVAWSFASSLLPSGDRTIRKVVELIDAGRRDDAITLLQSRVRRRPDPDHLMMLGWLLAEAQRNEEALATFRAAEPLAPNDSAPVNAQVHALHALGRIGEAADLLEADLARRPRDLLTLANLCRSFADRGRPHDAVRVFHRLERLVASVDTDTLDELRQTALTHAALISGPLRHLLPHPVLTNRGRGLPEQLQADAWCGLILPVPLQSPAS